METIVRTFTEAKTFMHDIAREISDDAGKTQQLRLPDDYLQTADQFFDLAIVIDEQGHDNYSRDDITDIADQGLHILSKIYQWTTLKDFKDEVYVVQQITMQVVKWVIEHHGQLKTIDLVVDTLAAMANRLNSADTLEKLAFFMGQVQGLCSDEIKQDFDALNPYRPWRILNLNRSIVATRTHNPDVMRDVFEELLTVLPQDAPEFFREGLNEMERLDYPDHVSAVVQEYYHRSQHPRIH